MRLCLVMIIKGRVSEWVVWKRRVRIDVVVVVDQWSNRYCTYACLGGSHYLLLQQPTKAVVRTLINCSGIDVPSSFEMRFENEEWRMKKKGVSLPPSHELWLLREECLCTTITSRLHNYNRSISIDLLLFLGWKSRKIAERLWPSRRDWRRCTICKICQD